MDLNGLLLFQTISRGSHIVRCLSITILIDFLHGDLCSIGEELHFRHPECTELQFCVQTPLMFYSVLN